MRKACKMGTKTINYHGEMVRYHNDLNKIVLPSFDEKELNLLFTILSKVKKKKAGEIVNVYAKDFYKIIGKNYTNKELADIILTLKYKFFKADFTILLETDREIGNATINLFQTMAVWCVKDNIYDGKDFSKNFTRVELALNPLFEYILNDLVANFTEFELAEFVNIKGKYAKILYYHLKQFRSTGKVTIWQNSWEKFRKDLDIPKDYQQYNINQRILKPAIKELMKERTLFDQERIPFQNLKYEKIKGTGRGRGGNVIGIVFTFTPQRDLNELEQAQQENKQLIQKNERLTEQRNSAYRQISSYEHQLGSRTGYEKFMGTSFKNKEGETIKILRPPFEFGGKIEVEFKNQEKESIFQRSFESENQLKSYIEKHNIIFKAW